MKYERKHIRLCNQMLKLKIAKSLQKTNKYY